MKKTLSILTGFFLIFMLAACNQTAEPVNEPSKNNGKSEKQSELTLEEVFKKSTEASSNLKSFAVKMDMEMDMSSDVEELNMKTQSEIDMKVVTEPMAFHQKMAMTVAEELFETESYFSEDGMFFYEPTGQQWMKFPQDMTEAFLQISGQQQANPGEELQKLQGFVDDFTFEQDSKNYILKLNASGEKFSEFIKEVATKTLPPEMAGDEEALNEVLKNMKINKVNYEFLINKETFYPDAVIVDMEMEMTAEGQTMVMKQKVNGQYSDYNKVDTITVPQEIIDSAVEMEM
ncbi:DUF6612 family protein [Cytobacillus dafuensis]|uniref:Lipoprotein n=1 Tax=Cytobacillus dafuensis TaxID=1742359 RepID=A0A5B8Z9U0_CYTDA|nr:DUF6612 family protein [Cytobacillus dafuensis]QED49053.1 hypothetical protein FSZ17_18235 [Cytobacillus dafuensis]